MPTRQGIISRAQILDPQQLACYALCVKVHNVRHGFATNSSSTHSIVYMRGAKLRSARAADGFGWGKFTLVDKASKRQYLAAQIYNTLSRTAGHDIAMTVAMGWTGATLTPDTRGMGVNEYVDHQSVISLPSDWDGRGINREFVEEFAAFLDRDDVAVLGGNDNGGRHLALSRPDVESAGLREHMETDGNGSFIARRDDTGFWTLFNRKSGNRMRVSFGDHGFGEAPTRAMTPELSDCKITDWCNAGCPYCYQNSTTKGKHADKGRLASLAYALRDLKVFEVALGGGETTAHPDFIEILNTFRDAGIVPNFTTKDTSWMRDTVKARKILGACGAFAYSANTDMDVYAFADVWKTLEWKDDSGSYPPISKATIQHVVGTTDDAEFRHLLLACVKEELPITLLGYKTVGRGLMYTPTLFDWVSIVADVVKEHHVRIGIDTTLVDTSYASLLAAGVPDWCLTRYEGKFSCYIDAVSGKMGPSSFCADKQYSPLNLGGGYAELVDTIRKTFQTY